MTIRQTVEAEVRVSRSESVTLLFTPLHGGEPARDEHGSIVRFGIPLDRNEGELAELVRELVRWLTSLAVQDLQSQQAAVLQATAPKGEPGRKKS